ncbi:MAG: bifunctional 4-hydroxy-2-oxoglutarate aldolase/2-dehydro-3-deoxy-phosphogluconate aldolase [Eubacterium sp.]|nr:bifunctional 4-hydroxy-2-oxoglutarate aldolase/2-dehydro-3-deoxy-phosphogluconate aldolase [Eubacterium sp.]
MDIFKRIREAGIIPVVTIHDEMQAVPLAEALRKGKMNCIEVTLRTEKAFESIHIIKKNFPDSIVGAGTVLTIEQVKKAITMGADFIVSPGSNPRVIDFCIKENITIIPGVATPSEIEKNMEMGIKVMKFFPAEACGGLNMIKAISAPYGDVMFMPTGGINEENVKSYLENSKVIACGGSWMVQNQFIEQENFSEITKLAARAMSIVNEVR